MATFRNAARLAVLLALAPPAARGLERTDLLPAGAQTHLRVSNTAAFLDKLKLSPLGRLWADPQFQDFLGNPEADIWQELFFGTDSEAEARLYAEQFRMLAGETILAFDPDTESPYLVAAMAAEDFARSLAMDERLKELGGKTFEILVGTFQGVEVVRHLENPGTDEERSTWQAHTDGTFVMGPDREWVEQCIVRLRNQAIEEPAGENPELAIDVPVAKLVRRSIEAASRAGTPALLASEALLDALGVTGIESLSMRLELRDNEMVAENRLRISSLGKGLFTLLDVRPSPLPSVAFIPADIASIEVGRFNLLRFWQEIPRVLDAAMPAVRPQFDLLVALLRQQAGANFEQDLLANLGTTYLSFSVAEPSREISVVAIELQDAAAFRRGLEASMAAPALQPRVAAALEIQEFLGHTLYTLRQADPQNPAAFAVAGNHLFYGHPDGVRQVVRSEAGAAPAGPSYEQAELVRGLRRVVPPQSFAYSAIDWKKNMARLVRELGRPQRARLIQQRWATSGTPLPPPDFGKLPPAGHIASFFNVSYQHAEADADGLRQRIILEY